MSEKNKDTVETAGTVLIIDDEPTVIDILELCFEEKYTTFSATSGAEGLALARAVLPDVVLLDIGMPDINGYELCRLLREDSDTQNIPIIFITAFGSVEDETRGLQAGAVDYIAKPINPALVDARVSTHVELKRQRDYLQALCRLDGLTGVYNRRGLDDFLDREWRRAARVRLPLSFILMDIDAFKPFNDCYGHIAGDDCLKTIADALNVVPRRGGDFVARYGGEEFAAVLPETPFESACQMGERFRAAVQGRAIPHERSSTGKVVTISIGVATLIPEYGSASSLLVEAADRSLYEAKSRGGNSVCAQDLGGSAVPRVGAGTRGQSDPEGRGPARVEL